MVKIALGYCFEHDSKTKGYTLVYKETRNKFDFPTKTFLDEKIEAKTTIGYYSNIEQLCKAAAEDYVSRKADAGEVTNIHEWLTEYRNAVKELVAAINGTDATESNED